MPDKFISLNFDDGWKSAIQTAEPLLDRYKIPATFYIITDRFNDSRYMDVEDLHFLEDKGHEIGAHTKSHKHLPELSDEEIWSEVIGGFQDLLDLGFKTRTFAYPFGEWNPYVVKQVREAGFFAARSIERGANDQKSNPFLLRACGVKEEHSLGQITSWISEFLKGDGKLLILYLHQIEPAEVLRDRKWIYGTTPKVLEGVLDFIKKNEIQAVTLEKGMEQLVWIALG